MFESAASILSRFALLGNLQALRRVAQDCAHERLQTSVLKVGWGVYMSSQTVFWYTSSTGVVLKHKTTPNVTQRGDMADTKQNTTQLFGCYTYLRFRPHAGRDGENEKDSARSGGLHPQDAGTPGKGKRASHL